MNGARWIYLGAVLLLQAAISSSFGQAPAKGFDAFPLAKTRNIFDPSRRAVRNEPPPETRNTPRNRPNSFTLTGTMVAEGRSLAFFSGSRSEYSKVIKIGEDVGGYKVTAITPIQAELEHEGRKFVLAVGHRYSVDGSADTGPAEPEPANADGSATAGNSSGSPSAPNAAPGGATPASAPGAGGDKSEILRRMMERRQKEMSK